MLLVLLYRAIIEGESAGVKWLGRRICEFSDMTPLSAIASIPAAAGATLERRYGIRSAEALYEHAARNGRGIQRALGLNAEEFGTIVRDLERNLPAEFVKRCRQPVVKHKRGVIID